MQCSKLAQTEQFAKVLQMCAPKDVQEQDSSGTNHVNPRQECQKYYSSQLAIHTTRNIDPNAN